MQKSRVIMVHALDQSDTGFLNDMHRHGPGTVQALGVAMGVTATAIRQRLSRLQAAGFVARDLARTSRGRPHYIYRVTNKGLRTLGDNYGDLALILWREIRNIADASVRQAVTNRVRDALVSRFGHLEQGELTERLGRLRETLHDRGYDVEICVSGGLQILRENNCPYQELAEEDRGICDLEQDVFQRVLGADIKRSQCCLDGHNCCEFEVSETSRLNNGERQLSAV